MRKGTINSVKKEINSSEGESNNKFVTGLRGYLQRGSRITKEKRSNNVWKRTKEVREFDYYLGR